MGSAENVLSRNPLISHKKMSHGEDGTEEVMNTSFVMSFVRSFDRSLVVDGKERLGGCGRSEEAEGWK